MKRSRLVKRAGWRGPTVFLLAVFAAGAVLFSGRARGGEWYSKTFRFRRRVIIERFFPGATACWVRFSHYGALQSDGRDVRVLDAAGKTRDREILRVGPGDQVEVLFDCTGAKKGSVFTVYFGSKYARPSRPWRAKAGVVLEARKKAPGGFDNWKQYKKTFDASKKLLGRTLRPKIFDGFNPLGPNENYVARYRAWFRTNKSGGYKFATNSDDASFLFVDGKLIASYPGRHGKWSGRWGQHNGTLHLERGIHELKYYYVQESGDSATVAAWQRPGDRHLRLMRERDFVPVAFARAEELERADGRPTLDFSWRPVEDFVVEGAAVVAYDFECRAKTTGALRWDFGDGTTATTRKTGAVFRGRHLFLRPGRYSVKLALRNGSSPPPVQQTVVVERVWAQREEFKEDRWPPYRREILRRLRLKITRPADLSPVTVFAAGLEDKELLRACADLAWETKKKLAPADYAAVFFKLGMSLQKVLKDYDGSDRAFQEVLRARGAAKLKARAKLHRAGLLIHVKGENQKGLELLKTVAEKNLLPPAEPVLRRIYLADALAGLGRRREALRIYEGLRNVVPLTDRRYAVGRRSRLLAVRNRIKTGDLEGALQELRNIEWETPLERVNDETGLLRVRCYLADKDYRPAVALLERLLKVNPTSGRRPEILYLLMRARLGLKDAKGAARAYERLRKEHPYAAETALAARLVKQ